MIGRHGAEDWVRRYIAAWTSNQPADIDALFTSDAIYRPTPFSDGWNGRAAIRDEWLARRDEPDTWTFEWELIAADGDVGVVQARTMYRDPAHEYSNIWVVRFDEDGRCREFTEWWVERGQPDPGQPA
ncbi:MAG TPA: nuclear transport factor 2 family protein [Candidatus Limnocylindrales bacterium]|nr:nuclear transport factor 2 family protein [Candidatus Limnocylindrales bacterium]